VNAARKTSEAEGRMNDNAEGRTGSSVLVTSYNSSDVLVASNSLQQGSNDGDDQTTMMMMWLCSNQLCHPPW
jgi:hypothetical protein